MSFSYRFFHQYLQISRAYTKKLNEQLAQIKIHQAQWAIIYYLHNVGKATLVSISHYFDVEKPTITRTVNRLEELGLVEQIPGKDRRERRIQLTDVGFLVYKEAFKIVDQFEKSLMKNISEKDYETTRQTLLQLQKNIKGDWSVHEK